MCRLMIYLNSKSYWNTAFQNTVKIFKIKNGYIEIILEQAPDFYG
jgi:hypothetical protein